MVVNRIGNQRFLRWKRPTKALSPFSSKEGCIAPLEDVGSGFNICRVIPGVNLCVACMLYECSYCPVQAVSQLGLDLPCSVWALQWACILLVALHCVWAIYPIGALGAASSFLITCRPVLYMSCFASSRERLRK